MDLKKIITISGEPDLFELITNTPKGIIVESIVTKKRSQAFASQRVNSLEDIAIYTEESEVPLKEVFVNMYKHLEGKQAVSHKDDVAKIKQFFDDFFPEYDKDRVKVSVMKRILKWYNLLNENNLVDEKIEEETEEEAKEETTDEQENADDTK